MFKARPSQKGVSHNMSKLKARFLLVLPVAMVLLLLASTSLAAPAWFSGAEGQDVVELLSSGDGGAVFRVRRSVL